MNYLCIKNSIVYLDDKVIDKTFKNYINDLSYPHFKSLDSIRNSTKKLFNIKRNIPLYISEKALLFPIIALQAKYYINYYEVFKTSYNKNILSITFKSGETLNLEITYSKYKTLKDNMSKILSYLWFLGGQ